MSGEYLRAKKMGERAVHRAAVRGEYPYLPALDHLIAREGNLAEIPIGLCELPLRSVVGTKTGGRSSSFAGNYMPILGPETEFGTKWQILIQIQEKEGIRDAVKAYEYMWRFYVEEGNKRVSVLKYLGVPEILANVTRVMPKKTDDRLCRAYYEFTDFYNVCPIYGIEFTEPGSYKVLAEAAGRDLLEPWPEDAVMGLRSAFYQFERLFLARGGGKMDITVSEAFLIYVRIYSPDSLISEPESVLAKRMERVWGEFAAAAGRGPSIEAEPEEAELRPGRSMAESSVGGIRHLLKNKPAYSAEHPLRIAFIHRDNHENSGWVYGHELGRNRLEDVFGGMVETAVFEDCGTDEKMRRAVEAARADGDEMVITTSPALMPETLRMAVEHPEMKFLNCSVNLPRKAVRTYSGRMYEAKFLLGCLAASVAGNHKIGYREGLPVYGSISCINAFAIGAALIDPEVKVYLSWSSQKNADWRKQMYEQGISVFSGPDLIRPEESSREYGIYTYGEDGRVVNLAMPVWDWGRYYELIVRALLSGSWDAAGSARRDQSMSYWWGMSAGVIDVILSDQLSYYSKKMVGILKNALIAETLNPFDGELRSQNGIVKRADAPRLTYEEIICMDWLNDNVIGRIPELDEIVDSAKTAVAVNGVLEETR
ncbi:MAG: BMP family ABC transporter substrate-binding protein [Lachnospiraceae bacterium]|nr:BMP family ABC transporter substrate-binding protein [Lachnospiraceae bacterium]